MTGGEPPSDGNSAGESTLLSLLAAVAIDLAADVVVGAIGRSERRFLVGRLLMS